MKTICSSPGKPEQLVRKLLSLAPPENRCRVLSVTTACRESGLNEADLVAVVGDGDVTVIGDWAIRYSPDAGRITFAQRSIPTAEANASQQFESAKLALARAEREAAITALETQIAALTNLDNAVENALADLKQASASLFAAVGGVAEQLRAMDETRFGSDFGWKLTALIKESVYHRFEELNVTTTERRPSFIDRASGRLRSAIAQLRYEALQGHAVPARGEKLYRTVNRITGLRNLDLSLSFGMF